MDVKVGDRVRSLVTEFDVREGGIYEVAAVFGDSINVYDDVGDDYRLMSREFEPVAVADSNGKLRIVAGGFYRTRDGRKVGPATDSEYSSEAWPWNVPHSGGFHGYATDGKSCLSDTHDIIAEWADEPVAAGDSSNADIFDELEDWMADNPLPEATPTTGFTVPLAAPEFGGAELDDDDIVEMSIGELTGAIADALRVVGKKTDKSNALKRGDLVVFNRPGMITGIDKYTAHVQTDGGNYSLPLTALRAA